ncbi:calcium-binding protein [Sphingomonas sp.]|uniref:beta strand repeat-containing protein n=1 Tax=Sphingomonas sp. TaxID=28214 RepID=UPI0025EAA19F|nr:calcium-binding protein [Sphingomonas sp.]
MTSSNLFFPSGAAVRLDTAGDDTLTTPGYEYRYGYGEYVDIRKGGSDTVTTGFSADTIYVGAALDAGDRINGGLNSSDTVILGGVYQNMVVLGADTITGVTSIVAEAGSIIRLKLDANTVASAPTYAFNVDARAQGAGDLLALDGSAATGYFYAYGGGGDDTIQVGSGGSRLYGGAGNDTLIGGAGADALYGEEGSDTLHGGGGNDVLDAGYDAAGVVNQLYGDAGNDTLTGGIGDDLLDGGDDNDSLSGGAGNDTLFGGAGNDTLSGNAGTDQLTGGAGADRFVVSAESRNTVLATITDFNQAEGDRIVLDYNSYNYAVRPAILRGVVAAGFTLTEGAHLGGEDAGKGFSQFWSYRDGSTTYLIGDLNDNRVFDSADSVLALTGPDTPAILTLADFTATSFSSARIGTGGDDVIDGTSAADWIYGISGNDTINGYGGDDALYGGDGNDTLYGQDGRDQLYGEAGNDTIHGGAGDDILSGGTGDDLIYGDDGQDLLNGDDGSDTLYAGNGDDYLFAGDDAAGVVNQLYGEAGNDKLTGGFGDELLDGGAGNDLLQGNDGADTLLGGDDDDTLIGGGGRDVLNGGAGNDVLTDGLQGDTLTGGSGADTFFVFSNLAAIATVTDFNRAEGDKLSGMSNPAVSAFVGPVAAGFTLTLGAHFGGDDLPSYLDLFFSYRSGSTTYLVGDLNGDRVLDPADFVVALAGPTAPAALIATDFAAGALGVRTGTAGNDSGGAMDGTAAADIILGLDGNDTINGLGGTDWLYGGAGNDVIDGGADADLIYGGTGNDTLRGGDGADTLYGDDGADTIHGGNDNDVLWAGDDAAGVVNQLYGDAGNDVLNGSMGNDLLDGGDDDDTMIGWFGTDTLRGGNGNDILLGGEDDDVLEGGAGNDRLRGDGGSDTMTGGTGADTFALRLYDTAHYISTLATLDTITDFNAAEGDRIDLEYSVAAHDNQPTLLRGSVAAGFSLTDGAHLGGEDAGAGFSQFWSYRDGSTTYLIGDLNDNRVLDTTDLVIALTGPNTPTLFTASDFVPGTFVAGTLGTSGDDTIDGTTGNDVIYGLAGNDTINGLDGNDVINGGAGADLMTGGEGDDIYYVDNVGDKVIELQDITPGSHTGSDTIYSTVSYSLFQQFVETLTLGGTANIDATGNAQSNRLNGNSGNNVLNGMANADVMAGGKGDDTYYVDNAGDQVIEADGEGNDTVYGSVSFNAGTASIETVRLTGAANIDVIYANSGANTLYGNSGNNVLNGGGGGDTMIGGDGDDTYYVDNIDDKVIELQGNGTGNDTVYSSISYSLAGQFIETLTLTNVVGDNALNATGNSQANTLNGNDGNNVLNGMAGADIMAGGRGDDTYYVDNIGDKAIEWGAQGHDTVYSSVSYDLAGQFIEVLELIGFNAINALGNSQANTLIGNSGDNVFTGRAGADTFGFRAGFGHDAITDFTSGGGVDGDFIAFASGTFSSYGDVMAHTAMVGNDTVITLDANNSITLKNKQMSALSSADFVFGGF